MRPSSATNGDVPRRRSRSSPSALASRAAVSGKSGCSPTVDAGVSLKMKALDAIAEEVMDDETTIAEAEATEERDDTEAARLASEAEMPLEDLLRLQGVDVDAYANDNDNYAASGSSDGSSASTSDEERSARGSSSAAVDTDSDTPDALAATPKHAVSTLTDAVHAPSSAAQSDVLTSLGGPGGQRAPAGVATQRPAPPRPLSAAVVGAKQAPGSDADAGLNGVVCGRGLEDAVADFVQSRGVVEKPASAVAIGSADKNAQVDSGVVACTSANRPDVPRLTPPAADGGSPLPDGTPRGRDEPPTASPTFVGAASTAKPSSVPSAMAKCSGSNVASPVVTSPNPAMGLRVASHQPVPGGATTPTPMVVSSGTSPKAASSAETGALSTPAARSTSAAEALPRTLSAVATEAEPTYAVEEPTALLRGGHLRSYQRAGLDWLAALYSKKLNGVLADDMGLGKTIMTIALFAHLALEHHLWGPHLIVVPTSVMLNWEIEFKRLNYIFKF